MVSSTEEYRALLAIQAFENAAGGRRIVLHGYEQPELRVVGAGVKVACHLYPEATMPVVATPVPPSAEPAPLVNT